MMLMIENGLGRNPVVVMNTDPNILLPIFNKAMVACTGIIFGLTMFKLSVLALYFRIFRTITAVRRMCIILGAVMLLWCVLGEILNFFRCMHGIGRQGSLAGPCALKDPQWNYYVAVPTVVFDICVVLIPIKEVWKLKLQRFQRVAVIGLFILGSTVTGVSCYKIYLLAVEVTQNRPCECTSSARRERLWPLRIPANGCRVYLSSCHLSRGRGRSRDTRLLDNDIRSICRIDSLEARI